MTFAVDDTIAALASAPGGAARGVVRISGPEAPACVDRCFVPTDPAVSLAAVASARRVEGVLRVAGEDGAPPLAVPGSVLVWPGTRSYTRQPAAEFHTCGSPAVLAAVVEELCRQGARAARPGEFTLRGFLGGRIDLMQAEAVLGVIDAAGPRELSGALAQLAGGMSRPLAELRERLLATLAELEAGLDFSEDDVPFIERDALRRQLDEGRALVDAARAQLHRRDRPGAAPRIVLAGAPNAGKSRLFNALVDRYGQRATIRALVSPVAGTTRDYLAAPLDLDGVRCELVDAAGSADSVDRLDQLGQDAAAVQRESASLTLRCFDATAAPTDLHEEPAEAATDDVVAFTKVDRLSVAALNQLAKRGGAICCSSVSGAGLEEVAAALRAAVGARGSRNAATWAASAAARCLGSLDASRRAFDRALALAVSAGSEELIAEDLRHALEALGDVLGATCADDVLDRVFGQFCIGK